MGLLDQVLGNVLGSRAGGGGGGGFGQASGSSTSPLMKALMLLLATKAFQHYTSGRQAGADPGGARGGSLDPTGSSGMGGLGGLLGGGAGGGGLGGMLSGGGGGGLGGMLSGGGGGGLGNMMSGGLGGLLGGLVSGGGLNAIVNQFRQNGHGAAVDSWIGHGQNQRLAPMELAQALGPDTVDELEQQTGMPRDQVLSELSEELPEAMNQFTPDGRLPTEDEVKSRWV